MCPKTTFLNTGFQIPLFAPPQSLSSVGSMNSSEATEKLPTQACKFFTHFLAKCNKSKWRHFNNYILSDHKTSFTNSAEVTG